MDSLEKRRNTYEKLNYYDLITLCIKRKDKIDELKKENERLKDKMKQYFSKNEKAIEYIKNHTEERCYREPYNIDGMPDRIEYFVKGKWNLLDILQGSDKDE